mmetsp:Transcript_6563/g.9765  ORF Transcript_6563/g.9765 Transcript_6563/m.9765 type:complete len:286 (+) Transcript_6563:773-1630(+)
MTQQCRSLVKKNNQCARKINDLCVESNSISYALNDHVALGAYFFFLETLWGANGWDLSGKDSQVLILPAELFLTQHDATLNRIASWLNLHPWFTPDQTIVSNNFTNSSSTSICSFEDRNRLWQFYQPYNIRLSHLLQPYHLPKQAGHIWSLPQWLLLHDKFGTTKHQPPANSSSPTYRYGHNHNYYDRKSPAAPLATTTTKPRLQYSRAGRLPPSFKRPTNLSLRVHSLPRKKNKAAFSNSSATAPIRRRKKDSRSREKKGDYYHDGSRSNNSKIIHVSSRQHSS